MKLDKYEYIVRNFQEQNLMSKFCTVCDRILPKDYTSGIVKFICECGNKIEGSAEDAKILSKTLMNGKVVMYDKLIKSAPFDKTTTRVAQPCSNCGREYMTSIFIGSDMQHILSCKCQS